MPGLQDQEVSNKISKSGVRLQSVNADFRMARKSDLQINDPDALSFFLPGVASGLSRSMVAPKAGSLGTAAAVRALSTLLSVVLADAANPGLSSELLGLGAQPPGLPAPEAPVTAAGAMQVSKGLDSDLTPG